MKKIYAMEVRQDFVDLEAYYPELEAVEDNVSILGNRHFAGVNVPMVEDIKIGLTNSIDDFEDPDASKEDKLDVILYEFGYLMNGEPTEDQLRRIYDSIDSYVKTCNTSEEEEICDLLEIVHGEKFVRKLIRGCCQGDWNYCYLPVSKLDKLSYIEAVYFATGTEFMVTTLEDAEGKSVNEIADEIAGSKDSYFDYTELYNPADIKKHIADTMNAKPEDIVWLGIDSMHTTTTYDYKIS